MTIKGIEVCTLILSASSVLIFMAEIERFAKDFFFCNALAIFTTFAASKPFPSSLRYSIK